MVLVNRLFGSIVICRCALLACAVTACSLIGGVSGGRGVRCGAAGRAAFMREACIAKAAKDNKCGYEIGEEICHLISVTDSLTTRRMMPALVSVGPR